jgi:hypothetical protein
MANLPYYGERAWYQRPLRVLPANGSKQSFSQGEWFGVPAPSAIRGIYECTKDGVVTSVTSSDYADFQDHVDDGEFVILNDTTTLPTWHAYDSSQDPPLGVYQLGDKVYLTGDFKNYYEAARDDLMQATFTIFIDGDYPLNPNNEPPEYVTSAFRNEGYYLLPRGDLYSLQFVPRISGMMYLALDTNQLFVFTDGKGASGFYGWYPTARLDTWAANGVGMMMGWLWPTTPNKPPPPGWKRCDGTALSKITYSALFAIIGTSYGEDVDANTFNLPEASNQIIYTGVF